MKRVVITGANGRIGSILKEGLISYELTCLDFPDVDVRDYEKLLKIFPGHDAVVHLAWNQDKTSLDNRIMILNVYKAAMESKVPRVVMASSVHADKLCPYSIDKIFMEDLGRGYASKGLEVICIRFGDVYQTDKPSLKGGYEKLLWLSHRDCVKLLKKCVEADTIPDNFLIVYGISGNKNS